MFSPEVGRPIEKTSKALTLLSSFQTAEYTAFTFSRRLNECDSTQYQIIRADIPIWFIFALGTSNVFKKHADGDNGLVLVDLSGNFFGNDALNIDSHDVSVIDVISPAVTIPISDTVYCYSYHVFDFEKRHIIIEEPIINNPLIHHFVAYTCDFPQNISIGSSTCNILTPPNIQINFTNFCSKAYLVWGKGGSSRVYPYNVGKPIGLGPLKTAYIILEVHYSNPSLLPNQNDSGSGLRLTTTSKLRQHDAQVLMLGTSMGSIMLPPGKSSTSIDSNCPATCTSEWPDSGLTVLTTFTHMHRRGISASTRHIRNGLELEPLMVTRYYDFNYQTNAYLPHNFTKLMPGDRLLTRCEYDTFSDTLPVRGGFSSEEEMCYIFVEYYANDGVSLLYNCGLIGSATSGIYCDYQNNTKFIAANSSELKEFSLFQFPECEALAVRVESAALNSLTGMLFFLGMISLI